LLEKGFGLLVTGFDTGMDLFGHGGGFRQGRRNYAQARSGRQPPNDETTRGWFRVVSGSRQVPPINRSLKNVASEG
jgi:hypothetical protein